MIPTRLHAPWPSSLAAPTADWRRRADGVLDAVQQILGRAETRELLVTMAAAYDPRSGEDYADMAEAVRILAGTSADAAGRAARYFQMSVHSVLRDLPSLERGGPLRRRWARLRRGLVWGGKQRTLKRVLRYCCYTPLPFPEVVPDDCPYLPRRTS